MYKVRAILDTQEDVIRTLMVDERKSLEELHFLIAKSFGFDGQEMASFYYADEEWGQGEEIPLFSMAEAGEGVSMATCILSETLPNKHDKLIYVYDFLNMWTFYVEVIDQSDEIIEDSKLLLAVGDMPEENMNNTFGIDDFDNFDDEFKEELEGDEFDDEFNDFERYDDFDFDNY